MSGAPNFLELSDEELLQFDESQLTELSASADEDATVDEDASAQAASQADSGTEEETASNADEHEEEEVAAADADTDEAPGAAEGAQAVEGEAAPKGEKDEDEAVAADDAAKTDAAKDTDTIDYKAEYERLTAPFKANGREIAVKSVDDAIALMQMGANYNKKMAALKPNLKLLKLLENNGLLDEAKLGYLIDLDKKNPEAINKLIKDSGIDPLDLSADKAKDYKPSTYTVDDRELELDTVLDELQGSPAYNRTLDVVSNKWDGASKQVIAQSPQILKVINTHIENGIYDIIAAEIESERLFGRLTGLSDLEAYRQVGDAIQARGGFNHLGQGRSPAQGQPAAAKPVTSPKPSKADEDKLREKRRAAGTSKPAAPASVPQDFNPLALSDEEFAKAVLPKFL